MADAVDIATELHAQLQTFDYTTAHWVMDKETYRELIAAHFEFSSPLPTLRPGERRFLGLHVEIQKGERRRLAIEWTKIVQGVLER